MKTKAAKRAQSCERSRRHRSSHKTISLSVTRISDVDALRPTVAIILGRTDVSRPEVIEFALEFTIKHLAKGVTDSVADPSPIFVEKGKDEQIGMALEIDPASPIGSQATHDAGFDHSDLIGMLDNSLPPELETTVEAGHQGTTPVRFAGGDHWVKNTTVFVHFDGPDQRKEFLKGRGYWRPDGNYDWRLEVSPENLREEVSTILAELEKAVGYSGNK